MRLLGLCLAAAAASLRAPVTRSLYPTGALLRSGSLPVSKLHSLYFEERGKDGGAPVLFLHGGPGAGCFPRHAGFFDPDHYRIVLFDQRGCGRSSPKGDVRENDTGELVADVERLRMHLGIARWEVVLGGSWGTCLALAYAAAVSYTHLTLPTILLV